MHEPRRPWLDPEALKAKFLSLSATAHPDRVHAAEPGEQKAAQDRYAEINAAFQCLREPKDRLKHLLELELGTRPQQLHTVPNDLMDLSMAVGQLCRKADNFLEEKRRAASPMLQVQLFERSQECTEQLQELDQKIAGKREQLLIELKRVDAEWVSKAEESQRRQLLQRLERIYPVLSYFERWHQQLQERLVQLAF